MAKSTSERTALPRDRFDSVQKTSRAGAHRITPKQRTFWRYLVGAIVAIAILTGAGIFAVNSIGSGVTEIFDGGSDDPPSVEQVKPELDPAASIAVLNGTPDPGLDEAVSSAITANGWGTISFSTVAATNDVAISAVFYTSVTDEAAALALANELGGVSIYQSYDYTEYGVQLVVLLGADYAGPGMSEAAE